MIRAIGCTEAVGNDAPEAPGNAIFSEVPVEKLSSRIHTDFMADNLLTLANAGQVSPTVAHVLDSLMLHPVLTMKGGKIVLERFCVGERVAAWEAFLNGEAKKMKKADKRVLFFTYGGIPQDMLAELKRMVARKLSFEKVIVVQATPSIFANCGPMSFGVHYMDVG